jgi:hypothetical protein
LFFPASSKRQTDKALGLQSAAKEKAAKMLQNPLFASKSSIFLGLRLPV